ncbi:MAG: hypothetical protein ACRDSL_12300 [Pseudonocardiaceae bacterium]
MALLGLLPLMLVAAGPVAPRHAPTGRAAASAVSVQEITRRLDRERATRARRPPRRVTVRPRLVPPPEALPGTAPCTTADERDDDR